MANETIPSDDALQPRPFGLGCVLLTIPPIVVGVVLIAYVALYFAGMQGHPAEGQRVAMTFVTCPEARVVLEKRVETMGLAIPSFSQTKDGWTITATLPADPGVAATIPETLAKRGWFEVRDPDQNQVIVNSANISETGVHLSTDGAALAIQLNDDGTAAVRKAMEAAPQGRIVLTIDGANLREIRNIPPKTTGQLEIIGAGNTEAAQVASSAERSVIVGSGALPCAAYLASVQPDTTKPAAQP